MPPLPVTQMLTGAFVSAGAGAVVPPKSEEKTITVAVIVVPMIVVTASILAPVSSVFTRFQPVNNSSSSVLLL
jgi:hypothetical protein